MTNDNLNYEDSSTDLRREDMQTNNVTINTDRIGMTSDSGDIGELTSNSPSSRTQGQDAKAQALQHLQQAIQCLAETPQASLLPANPCSSLPPYNGYIRMEDWDEFNPSMGNKCLLCKRDLTFAPEGPVFQPKSSPDVAVLPCGHTFHDHCLQAITPKDEAKNPPCIPCAIGES